MSRENGTESAPVEYKLSEEGRIALEEYDKSIKKAEHLAFRLFLWGVGLVLGPASVVGLIHDTLEVAIPKWSWGSVMLIALMIIGLILMFISWVIFASTPKDFDPNPVREKIIREHGNVVGPWERK